MKLKVRITGPKVHDVGYRFYLLGLAMSNRIKGFEAYNEESNEGAVLHNIYYYHFSLNNL
jgi:hypothetical protein